MEIARVGLNSLMQFSAPAETAFSNPSTSKVMQSIFLIAFFLINSSIVILLTESDESLSSIILLHDPLYSKITFPVDP